MRTIYKYRKIITIVIIAIMVLPIAITNVFADSVKIVALGADLTDEQQEMMLNFFNVNKNQAQVYLITNADERFYLQGIATEQQLGNHTYSCVYIEPTDSGGINVRTANLTWVTGDMIRNALITAGITNCNVVAAAPIEVSGTGALTGVFKAYPSELNTEKVEAASEELIATSDISNEIGQDEATELIAELKEKIIENEDESLTTEDIVRLYLDYKDIELSEENEAKLISLLNKISALDYDIDKIKEAYETGKETLGKISDNVEEVQATVEKYEGFFGKIREILDTVTGYVGNAINKLINIGDDENPDETYQELENQYQKVQDKFTELNMGVLGDSITITDTDENDTDDNNKEQEENDEESFEEFVEDNKTKGVLDKVTYDFQENK